MSVFDILQPPALSPSIHHRALNTTFSGVEPAPPPTCSSAARVHQYFGITYATIPARFRQSVLCSTYPETTDASKHGPICPQPNRRRKTEELLLGVPPEDLPVQDLKQDEFACLNLNITCPAGLTPRSRVPVMIWIHGGGDRGSGSDWLYDGANLVRKSIDYDKPIILVSINFRLGLLGFAASPSLREDNQAAGDEGVGNYGLRDQRVAMEWVHRYIGEFGGDPNNITLCGSGSGAADVLCHLLSRANETNPLFHRAISQSAVFEPIVPDVSNAGWQLSRIMSALQVTSVDKFRSIEAQKLLGLGQTIRAVNDGVFFRDDWHDWFSPETAHAHSHHKEQLPHAAPGRAHHGPSHGVGANLHPPASSRRSRSRSARPSKSKSLNSRSRSRATFSNLSVSSVLSDQPLLIGDNCCDSLLWSIPISLWTSAGVVRRLKAICQSLSKTSSLLRYYDLSSSTPDHEVIEHVLELVNDARVAWPTHIFADHARHMRGDRNVWRYVFDQEGPIRGLPHHAAELIYLFDNCPLPEHIVNPAGSSSSSLDAMEWDGEGPFYDLSDDEDGAEPPKYDPVTFRTTNGTAAVAASASAAASSSMAGGASPDLSSSGSEEDDWCLAVVDEYSYRKVKDTIQERWISFIHGESPWREDKIFVFGPEGETGERSKGIFEGRRRKNVWKEVFEPLGAQLVQKVGVELSRGPAPGHA